jgi:hypothetical protein
MATLMNYGVAAGRGGILMPKPKWRFRVRVVNFGAIAGGLELTQNVMTCSKPKENQAEQEVHSYNSIAYYGGKNKFDSITMVLRDDVTNVVQRIVGHQRQKQKNHFTQTTPLSAQNYKFQTYIESLDGGDGVLEQWFLEGCFLTNSDYGDWDYSADDPSTISLTIRYDNATLSGGLMPVLPQLIPGNMIG